MEQATETIHAGPAAIRHVLLDALALPEWNEAFLDIDGPAEADLGTGYALRVRPGFAGELQYTVVEPDRIEITWQVPGFREVGTWTIAADSRVTHTFEQSGPLATVLRPAYRNIATIRLARLANRVRQLTHAA
ncbi:SRPBCC family protein [Kribbella kalugense]|uniref:Polyketide cyclase/dehydrase/lipid transport protein n=1 Tax=Kribbella kalugense TaxID=2512221 RepID=A0A4R7ZPE9_9ACTN|nr:SRPBCC family protein [Kribbella kalugense]TDW18601.1 polyketide cyclase/dehydrase/lipid transport protein [Kribbella kalugense]